MGSKFLSTELSIPVIHSLSNDTLLALSPHNLPLAPSKLSSFPSISLFHPFKPSQYRKPRADFTANAQATELLGGGGAQVEDKAAEVEGEVEVAKGVTLTQFCDKVIDKFLNEKPRTKDWKKYLVFREEWKRYRDRFYSRCRERADAEADPVLKDKLSSLSRKVKKIDDEMDRHSDLLKEIEESPTDINAIVTKRRRDFSGEFFKHLNLLQQVYDSLESHDAMSRLAARCLSAVSAYDNTLEIVDDFDTAQEKFNDILNSKSIDAACEKIKSLAKGKQLDSSLILLINTAWAKARESTTMRDEVKEIMYRIYKATKTSLRSIAPKEIKLLKHLMNIVDPEERFSALASSFCPGNDKEAKEKNKTDYLYTTPKELYKWVTIMLDAYHLNQQETDIREAKQVGDPVVIQRLIILKQTIEEEYLSRENDTTAESNNAEEEIFG